VTRLAAMLICSLVAPGTLAACGEDEPVTVSGDGYSFEAPGGWTDGSAEGEDLSEGQGGAAASVVGEPDVVVFSDDESGGFRANLNVLKGDAPPGFDSRRLARNSAAALATPEQAESVLPGETEIEYDGAPPRRTSLGGETAFRLEYEMTTAEGEVRISQIYVVQDGTGYIATLTTAPEDFDSGMRDLEKIVDTWEFE
jgi:hypothetical protein